MLSSLIASFDHSDICAKRILQYFLVHKFSRNSRKNKKNRENMVKIVKNKFKNRNTLVKDRMILDRWV
jgi:hypothetical protein